MALEKGVSDIFSGPWLPFRATEGEGHKFLKTGKAHTLPRVANAFKTDAKGFEEKKGGKFPYFLGAGISQHPFGK